MTLMLLTIALTIFFSCISTAILSYISMAVMLGPWIDSTIVLASSVFFAFFARRVTLLAQQQSIALITIGASVGGIVATACGFAFPTLYFLDKQLFNAWLAQPWYFMGVMGFLAFCAGSFGFLLANLFEHHFMHEEQLPFPIGELSYKMISAQNTGQAKELSFGFIISALYSIVLHYTKSIPKLITTLPAFNNRWLHLPPLKISLTELPMLWAIGFIAGHSIAIPLGIGILAKNLICGPIHTACFLHLPFGDFLVAFAGGLVAYGAIISFLTLPSAFKGFRGKQKNNDNQKKFLSSITVKDCIQWIFVLFIIGIFLSYFKFSILSQLYLLVCTAVCTYQLIIIGGKIGIAPLARYATFVMLPGMMLFGYNALQITIVSTFVEICGGVAVELLFGRKVGQLSSLPSLKTRSFQWLGLLISALVIGICFWILITNLGLGSAQLLAQRSKGRALLVMVQSFDYFALILGALFASILKELKVNAIMVLGGLLMPTELALPLVFGGLSSLLVNNKEAHYPFWSGIFAANSLWMFIKVLL